MLIVMCVEIKNISWILTDVHSSPIYTIHIWALVALDAPYLQGGYPPTFDVDFFSLLLMLYCCFQTTFCGLPSTENSPKARCFVIFHGHLCPSFHSRPWRLLKKRVSSLSANSVFISLYIRLEIRHYIKTFVASISDLDVSLLPFKAILLGVYKPVVNLYIRKRIPILSCRIFQEIIIVWWIGARIIRIELRLYGSIIHDTCALVLFYR